MAFWIEKNIRFKLFSTILWSLILVFFTACEKSPTNPEVILTLIGFVYEANSDPLIPIEGARVMVGDVYGISDSTGHFVVDDILGRKGADNEYVFTITHQKYDTLRQIVIMRSDTTKNFFLVKKVDFFPAASGNYWIYDYYDKILSQMTHSLFIGKLKWEMIVEDENIYIREEQNGVEYFAEGRFSWEDETYTDTTYINNRVEIFQIDCLDKVTFYRDRWSRYTTTWLNNRINRFQSPTVGDTLHIDVKLQGSFYYKADYVKNIGLVSFDWFDFHYHETILEKANLIEYHINKEP